MSEWLQQAGARWVWPKALAGKVNQYVEFRQVFRVRGPVRGADLFIGADTDYAVSINGVFAGWSQFQDFPPRRPVDRIPVGSFLKKGQNTLEVTVYHQGVTSFQYLKGSPGVVYGLRAGKTAVVSGTGTEWRPSPRYAEGPADRITPQLGFVFAHDARPSRAWKRVAAQDLHEAAADLELVPRPLPRLQLGERAPAVVVAQGAFHPAPGKWETLAEEMLTAFLSARPYYRFFAQPDNLALPSEPGVAVQKEYLKDGFYLVVDLGREETGLLELEVDAEAGVRIDIAHGEHLDDLRVRARVGNRNFANRYVCRAGRQVFLHPFHRLAGRYVELHVSGARSRFTLHYAGLRPVTIPMPVRGGFDSADTLANEIHRLGVRTLQLCMHDHYEDCPWREQALYANDSRNQALSGYYTFGDPRFPAVSFGLLGDSLKPDGWLELCAPSEIEITIPSFTLVWILALADHWLYMGDRAFIRRQLPRVQAILRTREAEMRNGLLPCPVGQRYWQFYDWVEGMDGAARILPGEVRYDAPLNLLFVLALEAGATLAAACGGAAEAARWRAAAAALRKAAHTAFWDPRESAYCTYKGDKSFRHVSELAQALALLGGTAGRGVRGPLLARLAAGKTGWVEPSLSQSLYKYEALLTGGPAAAGAALAHLHAEWGRMALRGATSFWETRKGADDFGGAGSLCHGWSAVPVYVHGAYALGVRPVEPGFAAFVVDPVLADQAAVAGVVPTPAGDITVEWERCGRELRGRIGHPAGLRCVSKPRGLVIRRRVS